MDATVECGCCHRRERWSGTGDARRVEVLVPGGGRRPAGGAARGRLLVALDVAADPARHVVGDCPACGQPMWSTDANLPAVVVTEATPAGPLTVGPPASRVPRGRSTSTPPARS